MQPCIACMQYGHFHPWEETSQEEYGPGFSSTGRDPSSVHIFSPPARPDGFYHWLLPLVTTWQPHLHPGWEGGTKGQGQRTVTVKSAPVTCFFFYLQIENNVFIVGVIQFSGFWQMHRIVQPPSQSEYSSLTPQNSPVLRPLSSNLPQRPKPWQPLISSPSLEFCLFLSII